MYNLSSAKKAVNSLNHIIRESNDKIIEDFINTIFNDLDLTDIQKEKINQISFNIKDEISKSNLLNMLQKKKKRTGPKRALSEYNLFVQKEMPRLKKELPNIENKLLLSKVAELWSQYKIDNVDKIKIVDNTIDNKDVSNTIDNKDVSNTIDKSIKS